MEQIEFVKSGLMTSRIGLGTWAMGGWMWGGTDEPKSIATIRSAIDRGVTLQRILDFLADASGAGIAIGAVMDAGPNAGIVHVGDVVLDTVPCARYARCG